MRGKHEFYLKKEQTGEEYFTYLDDNGIANGPLKIKYSDGGYSTGFFKNGKKDSLFKTYGKAGVLKAITYYIDGKENGEHFIYSDLGNIVASVFMENDKMKTKKVYYHLVKNTKYNIGYGMKTYFLQDTVWIFSGELILDTNYNVVNNRKEPSLENSFYNVEEKTDSNGLLVLNPDKRKQLKIRFYRLDKNSDITVNIGEKEIKTQKYISQNKYDIDSTGILNYKPDYNKSGWHFVRGEFTESFGDGQKRIVPIYFNYYVP